MNEKRSVCFIYEYGFFSIGEKCFFCEFLPRVFQEREGGQKRPNKVGKEVKRRAKEG